ncbi:hypothetical protein DCAR_0102581 [Daucus carota subsp. sativus]|uniref:Uncharacterized protein n=1 Tax=Daucus carota subsp. sativus TaxID=79200 RepID=A0A169WS39_DAUCS|nr:PREDICTED: uncharacterized protein LOC108198249 [Daucus carota subsp. sativus]WOG83406.1 hypothetical protein DCAR_0102581 [Daucus carota subsp. sativus]
MANKSPVFQMPDAQHFSDYGFHPHFDYFQVVEEARKQRKGASRAGRSIDGLHLKLQKPTISHDLDSSKIIKKNKHSTKNNKRWWKHALHFFRGKWTPQVHHSSSSQNGGGVQCIGFSAPPPVYTTESRSGSTTPYRTTSRPASCPRSPAMRDEMDSLPYISLRDINVEQHHRVSASSPMPIYLVT